MVKYKAYAIKTANLWLFCCFLLLAPKSHPRIPKFLSFISHAAYPPFAHQLAYSFRHPLPFHSFHVSILSHHALINSCTFQTLTSSFISFPILSVLFTSNHFSKVINLYRSYSRPSSLSLLYFCFHTSEFESTDSSSTHTRLSPLLFTSF